MDMEKRGRVKTALALKIGGMAMLEATEKFGPSEVAKLLIVESAKGDWVADELLITLNTIIETKNFLNRCEWVWKPTQKEFEVLVRCKHICWG